jgi:protein-S-isoprenylcysteine O-methyltransferase Ste14
MFEKLIGVIYKIATGGKRKRMLLTPFAALLFFTVTLSFIILPLIIDRVLNVPRLIFEPVNLIICVLLLGPGLFLVLWSGLIFFMSKGTPVPLNPPPALITYGPYKFSRNPMITGLVLTMFAAGVYFGSITSVLIFTPAYIFIAYLELKNIEEPELIKRLGQDYIEYKNRVPMFFPWKKK